jgi:hypothetical protein
VQDRRLQVDVAAEPTASPRNFGLQLYPRMTEAKWLASDDAPVMLDYVLGRVSQRKLRLFAVACARKLWCLLPDQRCRALVDAAEQFADGQTSADAFEAARQAVWQILAPHGPRVATAYAAEAVARLGDADSSWAAYCLVRNGPWWAVTPPVAPLELAGLLRHIAGNPFRPPAECNGLPAPACWLAEALYAGEDCSFALRDALLEAGSVELAEHFREKSHPKGCWALDTILGRHP